MTPIVLHHGFCGYREIKVGPLRIAYFRGIDRALARRGYPVLVPCVDPLGSIARRARQLKSDLLRQLDALGHRGPIVIFGHSMGGLDARYMISSLGMEDRVAALVTITTPHRGTTYADWGVRHIGRRLGAFGLFEWLGIDTEGLTDLTTERCARFNDEVKDVPGVRYYSVSAARPWHKMPPFALHSHKIIADLVSVKSSTWANHLCTWPADHWHTVNKRFVVDIVNPTGDITPYYLAVVDRLVADGVIEAAEVVS
jgi:triacylglycerol lipase